MEIKVMTFPKKFLLGGNGLFRIQNGTSSQLWIRCKEFCTMKGAKRVMEIILMVFLKKILFGAIGHFGSKMVRPHIFRSVLRFFIFLILHNKRDQEIHENFIRCFLRKNLIWGNLIFLGHFLLFDWAWSKLNQATVTIGSLKSQGMIFFVITTGSLNS